MEKDDVNTVFSISGECVGKGLYSLQEMEATLYSNERFIYVLATGSGELAGYIYFLLTDRYYEHGSGSEAG